MESRAVVEADQNPVIPEKVLNSDMYVWGFISKFLTPRTLLALALVDIALYRHIQVLPQWKDIVRDYMRVEDVTEGAFYNLVRGMRLGREQRSWMRLYGEKSKGYYFSAEPLGRHEQMIKCVLEGDIHGLHQFGLVEDDVKPKPVNVGHLSEKTKIVIPEMAREMRDEAILNYFYNFYTAQHLKELSQDVTLLDNPKRAFKYRVIRFMLALKFNKLEIANRIIEEDENLIPRFRKGVYLGGFFVDVLYEQIEDLAKDSCLPLFKMLLSYQGSDSLDNIIYDVVKGAVEHGHIEALKIFWEHYDAQFPDKPFALSVNSSGTPAESLPRAAKYGNVAMVALMIEKGVDLNFLHHSESKFQKTALGIAVENEDMEMIELLLKNNARIDEVCNGPYTSISALLLAFQVKNKSIIFMLLNHVGTQLLDFASYKPLFLLAKEINDEDVTQALLKFVQGELKKFIEKRAQKKTSENLPVSGLWAVDKKLAAARCMLAIQQNKANLDQLSPYENELGYELRCRYPKPRLAAFHQATKIVFSLINDLAPDSPSFRPKPG